MARRRPGGLRRGERVYDPSFWTFISQHPELGSTRLIMHVYEALAAKGIPFIYSHYFGDALATTGLRESVRAHFYVPAANTAIIVEGGHWFGSASRLQSTSLTIALLKYAGINVLWWTEPELLARGVDNMITSSPELMAVAHTGGVLPSPYPIIQYRKYWRPPPHPPRKERQMRTRRRRRPK